MKLNNTQLVTASCCCFFQCKMTLNLLHFQILCPRKSPGLSLTMMFPAIPHTLLKARKRRENEVETLTKDGESFDHADEISKHDTILKIQYTILLNLKDPNSIVLFIFNVQIIYIWLSIFLCKHMVCWVLYHVMSSLLSAFIVMKDRRWSSRNAHLY